MLGKRGVIIGAGPAGLTAAYELVSRTDIRPIILESSDMVGGLARTVNHNGNRIDIGGHRFFSKSDRVLDWWLTLLPIEGDADSEVILGYQGQRRSFAIRAAKQSPEASDNVMLVRKRKSRIYFQRNLFDYPLSLNLETLVNLGPFQLTQFALSYLWTRLFPIKQEHSLEDFLINRFGRGLYKSFFRSYTEKVWGVPCNQISAEWGAQRIKGLSALAALKHSLFRPFRSARLRNKAIETSLIEHFLYPKHGPGQIWELCSSIVSERGAELHYNTRVREIHCVGERIAAVTAVTPSGKPIVIEGDYFFSTMAVQELIRGMGTSVPAHVREVADGLIYRDFITVGLLTRRLKIADRSCQRCCSIRDNWLYIQDPEVRLGRLQIFNNWSPHLVADPHTKWLGLEYFCNTTDELWNMADDELRQFAIHELATLGFIDEADVIDGKVLRIEKAYPAYFGTYDRFSEIIEFVNRFENLFLIGRNGMHRYNNQDHSMLTAMTAVDNIIDGNWSKDNIWAVNTEMEYHEAVQQKTTAYGLGAAEKNSGWPFSRDNER
jgi:protoporphyrinogen oxidase